jgi:putative spermidine/putrescine transport system substrate-binding protein
MKRRLPMWSVVVAIAAVVVGGLAFARTNGDQGQQGFAAAAQSWDDLSAAAVGQTVRLWMWGGEAALNQYIDDDVASAAAAAGVRLERVPIADTASAMSRLVAEADSRTARGAIDLLWVNGKNFQQGKEAGLWLNDWVSSLPNAARLDRNDPTLSNDFGVPTDGQEMPWSRASFVFAYDSAAMDSPPSTFPELLEHARRNPGRIAYPAPPDFTGSAFVRSAVQALGEEEAFALLDELKPLLWRRGRSFPADQAEMERLFATREIDLVMSYNPNFVDVAVRRGSFPDTVRPFVFRSGTLSNVSFLAIPARAPNPEGAMVVANLMLGADLQAAKADLVGIPSVLPSGVLRPASTRSPHRLDDYGTPLEELPVERVIELDRRWLAGLG